LCTARIWGRHIGPSQVEFVVLSRGCTLRQLAPELGHSEQERAIFFSLIFVRNPKALCSQVSIVFAGSHAARTFCDAVGQSSYNSIGSRREKVPGPKRSFRTVGGNTRVPQLLLLARATASERRSEGGQGGDQRGGGGQMPVSSGSLGSRSLGSRVAGKSPDWVGSRAALKARH